MLIGILHVVFQLSIQNRWLQNIPNVLIKYTGKSMQIVYESDAALGLYLNAAPDSFLCNLCFDLMQNRCFITENFLCAACAYGNFICLLTSTVATYNLDDRNDMN